MSTTQIYDVLCCGFGPASLSIAVALAEHNAVAQAPASSRSSDAQIFSSLGGLQEALAGRGGKETTTEGKGEKLERKLTACFIDKHEAFKWHPGMMLDGSRMQISFLKDLATLRNPQSPYTFICYLNSISPSRLISFISLATFTPTRREYADYLTWAARKVQLELEAEGSKMAFGEEVVAVEAVLGEDDVQLLKITSKDVRTGSTVERLARNIVLSTGGSARIPQQLTSEEIVATNRVVHSSAYLERVDSVLSSIIPPSLSSLPLDRPIRLAVIGAGQSAAEIFLQLRNFLAKRLPASLEHRAQIDLFIRRGSLRPADDSPFSNEVFDPGMSNAVFGLDARGRDVVMREARNTNYSVVNPRTLDTVYETMYAQKVDEDIALTSGSPHSTTLNLDPKLIIHPYTELTSAWSSSAGITLNLVHALASTSRTETYDAVFCATGYNRQDWKEILFPSSPSTTTTASSAVPLGSIFPPSLPSSPDESVIPLALPSHLFSERLSRHERASNPSTASHSLGSESRGSSSTAPSSRGSFAKAASTSGDLVVSENYRLQLPSEFAVVEGAERREGKFRPTVWLQGCNEGTHGISDSLLSVLAVRSGEVLGGLLTEGWFGEE